MKHPHLRWMTSGYILPAQVMQMARHFRRTGKMDSLLRSQVSFKMPPRIVEQALEWLLPTEMFTFPACFTHRRDLYQPIGKMGNRLSYRKTMARQTILPSTKMMSMP